MSKKHHTDALPARMGGWPFLTPFQFDLNPFMDRLGDLRADFMPPSFPAVDMSETDDAVEITAEVPGVSADEIDASIVEDSLLLRGGHDEKREEEGKDWHMVERRSGRFRRVIPLGFKPDKDGFSAKLSDGILRISVAKPKAPASKPHKIAIDAT